MAEPSTINEIIRCMRYSAMMLELADRDIPKYHELNLKQANLLRVAARDLKLRHPEGGDDIDERQ